MRVALVIDSLHGGGAERVIAELANHLASSGHQAAVLTFGVPKSEAYRLHLAVERIAIQPVGTRQSGRAGMVPRVVKRTLAMRRALAAMRPDVVVGRLPAANLLALLATWRTGVPVVACEGNDFSAAPAPLHIRLARRLLYPRLHALVIQSERTWDEATKLTAASRVRVIPNALPSTTVEAAPSAWSDFPGGAPAGRIVSVGRLEPKKGFDDLVRAMSMLARTHPDWGLLVLGEGSQRAALESLVEELGLAGRIWLAGHVNGPFATLRDSHIYVQPSRFEGWPTSLLEAMSVGLPVVAYDCPTGPREMTRDGRDGILVPVGDVHGLAGAIERLVVDASLRRSLGEKASSVGDRYSAEHVMPKWEEVLRSGARARAM